MSDKSLYYITSGIGGTIASFIPELWHASFISPWSILFTGIGGIAGIWVAYKYING